MAQDSKNSAIIEKVILLPRTVDFSLNGIKVSIDRLNFETWLTANARLETVKGEPTLPLSDYWGDSILASSLVILDIKDYLKL